MGQYIPGKSFLHKLDARVKIILSIVYMLLLFMSWNYLSIISVTLSVVLLTLLSGVSVKEYFRGTKVVIVFTLFSALLNIFYGEGEPIFTLGFVSITENGIKSSIIVALRIVDLILVSSMLMFTTSPNDISFAIEKLISPLRYFHVNTQEIAMMMTIALRFIPTLLEETNKIINAQKSRGADFENGNIVKRAKAMLPILMPLFVSSFRRAYQLAMAMDCRCYDSSKNRTRMKTLKMGSKDVLSIIMVSVLVVWVVVCNIWQKSMMI